MERMLIQATWHPEVWVEVVDEDAELCKRCAVVVGGIRFDATALPISTLEFFPRRDGVGLNAIIYVPDRDVQDKVEMLTVGRFLICPWVVLHRNGPEYLVRWMRETVANLLAHEVDESITYRGQRVFDPHASLK